MLCDLFYDREIEAQNFLRIFALQVLSPLLLVWNLSVIFSWGLWFLKHFLNSTGNKISKNLCFPNLDIFFIEYIPQFHVFFKVIDLEIFFPHNIRHELKKLNVNVVSSINVSQCVKDFCCFSRLVYFIHWRFEILICDNI